MLWVFAEVENRASKLAVLEEAATRYLQGHVHEMQRPWHHQLRGTQFQLLSDVIDRPVPLLIVALASLTEV